MIREWTVTREAPSGHAIFGTFDLGSGGTCHSLERLGVEIPEGRYRVLLTISNRVTKGSLWAPYPDHMLPLLVDVPHRSGIRIHSANKPEELEGCIAVGGERSETALLGGTSRPALTRVVNELMQAHRQRDDVWITVKREDHVPLWAQPKDAA